LIVTREDLYGAFVEIEPYVLRLKSIIQNDLNEFPLTQSDIDGFDRQSQFAVDVLVSLIGKTKAYVKENNPVVIDADVAEVIAWLKHGLNLAILRSKIKLFPCGDMALLSKQPHTLKWTG
jgi:hypothetical protein